MKQTPEPSAVRRSSPSSITLDVEAEVIAGGVVEVLADAQVAHEEAIKARASKFADLAVGVWSAPALPRDILDAYHPKAGAVAEYTIHDHPHLLSPSM